MNITIHTELLEDFTLHEAFFICWLCSIESHSGIPKNSIEEMHKYFKYCDLDAFVSIIETTTSKDALLHTPFGIKVNYDVLEPKYKVRFERPNLPVVKGSTPVSSCVFSNNIIKHLERFNQTGSVLENKINSMVLDKSAEVFDIGKDFGLALQEIESTFMQFMSYVSSNPKRFIDTVLIEYWAFWVQTAVEKRAKNGGKSKQQKIEDNNRHVAQNVRMQDTTTKAGTHSSNRERVEYRPRAFIQDDT